MNEDLSQEDLREELVLRPTRHRDRRNPPSRTRRRRNPVAWGLALLLIAASSFAGTCVGAPGSPHEGSGHQLFASPQSDPILVSPDGSTIYVANTTSNTVDILDAGTNSVVATVPVGLDPVALAMRPDGLEVWVVNHISDSVSVIDTNPANPTYRHVIETVQSIDADGVTEFDEPAGVAFASNTKAYVSLSSRNLVAIVDATTYQVSGSLLITNQEPRAMKVRDGLLYVLAFESGNGTELSACLSVVQGSTSCTLDINDLNNVATSPALPGVPRNVTIDPDRPDRDLFVFDTATDTQIPGSPISAVGSLNYGLAISSTGTVFVTNTNARNSDVDGNGLAAQPPWGNGLGLDDLGNRAFRNRVTTVDCGGASCGGPSISDLEPPPGSPVPVPLATPYGVGLSADDSTLVVTAAASSRIASINTGTMAVLDTLDVGEIPRGVAFDSQSGSSGTAWVLNTLGNSVSKVAVAANGDLTLLATIPVGNDPTPEDVRLGRIAFNDADGSTSGTFACASCHPDAGTDDLLWVIGATCTFDANCDQEEPRSTMTVRGLRGTLPLHWDGVLGDPFGGPNGEIGINNTTAPNCSTPGGDEHGCFLQLVDAALSGVMCDQNGGCAGGGELTGTERSNMAVFLGATPYAPARNRRMDDTFTPTAVNGFRDFFMDVGGAGGGSVANTCADTTGGCHELPLGTGTNSVAVGAFEAPTMRGLFDRHLQFSSGFTTPEEIMDLLPFITGGIPWNPAVGVDELQVFSVAFQAFNSVYGVLPQNMWEMFQEMSTGTSGATGRQISLNTATAGLVSTTLLLNQLEQADLDGRINLRGWGVFNGQPIEVSFRPSGNYRTADQTLIMSRTDLLAEVSQGNLVLTLTAHLRANVGRPGYDQPLLDVTTTGNGPTGDPALPVIAPNAPASITLAGTTVGYQSIVMMDGLIVEGTVSCNGGTWVPYCSAPTVTVDLTAAPSSVGTHLLQVMTPAGLQSNEVPICVGLAADCVN